MNSNPIFIPVQGTEKQIRSAAVQEGWLYVATDSGRMYLDTNTGRIPVGGRDEASNGAGLYYGSDPKPVEDENGQYYSIAVDFVDGYPQKDDLILNSDGGFYKVDSVTDKVYICTLLTVSGGSTGGIVETRVPTLLLADFYDTNIINGSSAVVTLTATSANNSNGNPLANKLTITWKLYEGDTPYQTSTFPVDNGQPTSFDFGPYLRESTVTRVEMVATGINHKGPSDIAEVTISTTALTLELDPDFSNKDPFDPDEVIFQVRAEGKIKKKMEVRFDNELVETVTMEANEEFNDNIFIDSKKCSHGYHTIQVDLYPMVNNITGKPVTPIVFEVAVLNGQTTPIVWLGNYQKTYHTYDAIQIPYLAYDPENPSSASIYLYKNGVQYDDVRAVNSRDRFQIWEISDADNESTNYYSIASGNTNDKRKASERQIEFKVVQDPRDLTVAAKPYLRLDFDPKGRSNTESVVNRQKWSYTSVNGEVFNGIFEKFNWYNNGWKMDDKNNTYLRISNGAKFTIPIGVTSFTNQSNTFEIMFKIRNVQNYGGLVKNITRYYLDEEKTKDDQELYNEFNNQTIYDNYDAFLQAKLGPAYDNLVFNKVDKILNLNNAVCKYCDGEGQNVIGWALGSQDAFFKDGNKTISVSYVDEDLVTLSIVYKYDSSTGKNMILFYLNGVLTGADYTDTKSFSIGEQNPAIEFNTDFCDIDLYKLRVYKTNLDVNEIVKNFCVDRKDIDNFDLINLAKKNANTGEYQIQFDKVELWNKEHPTNQTMPYIIFDTSNDPRNDGLKKDRLPWSKSTPMNATVTFVNTQLDQAYATGELEEYAGPRKRREDGSFVGDNLWNEKSSVDEKLEAIKLYYKHHCPSWTGNNCEIVVQGTSSEYYPRRNYKIKTKTEYDSDGEERVHIFLNKGPFEAEYSEDPENTRQDYWYMNNYTNGTHKWTMKVDYMESSGSYNAGFASMVGTCYSKHPLEDYIKSGAINTTVTKYKEDENGEPTNEIKKQYNGLTPKVNFTTQVDDNLTNANIRWEDYRTSLLGFPVMAFHKRGEKDYVFIGYYRMLLDKGSDEVLGFKPEKGVTASFLGNKNVRDIAECWEFSNNNRTYCSYRDPEDRVQLSFMPSQAEISKETGLTAAGIPIVADSFEYRYHKKEDYLDILYNLGKKDSTTGAWGYAGDLEKAQEFLEETEIDITSTENWPQARQQLVKYYSNWEKVCQWLWSTCLDNVVSMGNYIIAPVGNIPFIDDGSLFVENLEGSFDPVTAGSVYHEDISYYKPENVVDKETQEVTIKWNKVFVYNDEKYKYESNKFYENVDGVYSLIVNTDFNPDIQYYELIIDDNYKTKSDLLVAEAKEWIEDTEYYTWNKEQKTAEIRKGHPSVVSVGKISKEVFDNGTYYVASPVTYGSGKGAKTYYYDTQEYRAEKFVKELPNHFDLEYLATYFIMTEVFECYDSRGKNCMMASWGPQVEGGDYIWYPIFYDIDTQLGINNTGIPSFEFNVDVTLADNFSTSDSILWNNFYSFFRGSYIIQKYKHLKSEESIIFSKPLTNPPLSSIKKVESWYLYDPIMTNNIAARGLRPLIATNLDLWYKYITTTNIIGSTNSSLLNNGEVGWLGRDGEWEIDVGGKFYMLQGDRSQSRQAFLTKRIDYVDSWLGVGGYARSGSNCIWGRVSANDAQDTSDQWMEGVNGEQYWNPEKPSEKSHEFDAEYWLNLTPLYSTYVAVSDDAAAYPPVKYDGITPTHMDISAIESGVRKSKNYREQLLYIYGSNKMLDIGDMSNLYWREFHINGGAEKLTRLKLGHDNSSYDYVYNNKGEKEYKEIQWKNGWMNQPDFPSGLGSSGMPLLKEVNLCNITLRNNQSDPTLDFSTCEKLQNFRATGSNLTQVTFADGVSLDTLYLPSTIKSLSLVEANLLTSVLKEYPAKDATGKLQVTPGLYLESFFETSSAAINQLNLQGGNLGYGSFDLFSRFYELRKNSSGNRLTMTNINWCPYTQLVEGDTYDANIDYVYDNGHYGFKEYTYNTQEEFDAAIVRGELYKVNIVYTKVAKKDSYNKNFTYYTYDEDTEKYELYQYSDQESFQAAVESEILYYNKADEVTIETYNALKDLIKNTNFKSFENASLPANFTGIIYINNTEDERVDEYELSDTMTANYPGLKIFMKNVKDAYSAQFVVLNDNGSYTYVPNSNGDTTYKSIQKVSQADFLDGKTTIFSSPFTNYDPSNSKTHHTFVGWTTSLNPDMKEYSNVLLKETESDKWGTEYKGIKWGIITEGENNQIYYAVYTRRIYKATFLDRENPNYCEYSAVQYDPDGSYFSDNVKQPICVKPVENVETRYALRGWTATENYGGSYPAGVDISEYLVDVSTYPAISDTLKFYAVFQNESVYDTITDDKYFIYTYAPASKGGYPIINLNPEFGNNLQGKITLPANDPNGNPILGIGLMTSYYSDGAIQPKNETGLNITHIFFDKNSQYKYIENFAFWNHHSANALGYKLEGIYLPDTIRTIGNYAFAQLYDSTLKVINGITTNLNNDITSIGDYAFCGGLVIKSIIAPLALPKNLQTIGREAFRYNGVADFTEIPDNVTILPEYCFAAAPNICINTFGRNTNKLTTIGGYCFSGSGTTSGATITDLYFGQSVINLGSKCFANYGQVENVYTPNSANVLNWAADAFNNGVIINYPT